MKIGVSGASGKMGKRIIHFAAQEKEIEVVFGLEKEGHPDVGHDFEGVKITDNLEIIKTCDCLIDFSLPEATMEHLGYLLEYKKAVVIGTTGLSEREQVDIKNAAKDIPVVFSPNMSVGVNAMFRLVKEAAKILKNYDLYLEEAHHVHKKDSPSGTAKKLVQILNSEGFKIKDDDVAAIREDEIVGDHSVLFKSGVDEIEISHSAKTRDIFAQGSIRAAIWINGKANGFYSMDDVLF